MGTEQQWAFENLKFLLCLASVLALPDFSKQFDQYIDASKWAIGGALMQLGQFCHPIAYLSNELKPAEKNYNIYRV